MGLCKCPKKKVTNLFCFDHRVNVCEHCLVDSHYECVVQSYLQWLQDSDFSPTCSLCSMNLANSSQGPCIRLLCYDIFHWSCFNAAMVSLPATTAPAGYECPDCRRCVFPKPNQAGPVADALKLHLQDAPWARSALGLPPLTTHEHPLPVESVMSRSNDMSLPHGDSKPESIPSVKEPHSMPWKPGFKAVSKVTNDTLMTSFANSSNANQFGNVTTNVQMPSEQRVPVAFHSKTNDYDENKYARRPALTWLNRWIKTYFPAVVPSNSRHARYRRCIFYSVFIGILLIIFLYIFAIIGRTIAENDPMLNIRFNPDIKIGVPDNANPEILNQLHDVPQKI